MYAFLNFPSCRLAIFKVIPKGCRQFTTFCSSSWSWYDTLIFTVIFLPSVVPVQLFPVVRPWFNYKFSVVQFCFLDCYMCNSSLVWYDAFIFTLILDLLIFSYLPKNGKLPSYNEDLLFHPVIQWHTVYIFQIPFCYLLNLICLHWWRKYGQMCKLLSSISYL